MSQRTVSARPPAPPPDARAGPRARKTAAPPPAAREPTVLPPVTQQLQLQLLGPARVERVGHTPEPLRAERAHQLLALLALSPDAQPRERLATLFWPEHGPPAARRNLRKAIYRLRTQPVLPPVLEAAGQLHCTAPTDVQAFEQALDEGRLRDALATWAGPLCDGLEAGASGPFVQWLQTERDRLARRRRDAMLALAAQAPADAPTLARLLLAEDPLDEGALQLLLRTALRAGEQAPALRDCARFEAQLRAQLGVEPSAATCALRDRLAAGAAGPAPVPAAALHAASPAGALHAVPAAEEADFVGRRAELRELLQLLQAPAARWVTMVGPGGIGKTRLLRHALPQVAQALDAQAVWLAFDDLGAGTSLLPRVAPALGLPEPATPATAAAWGAAIGRRRIVLALDNLEHLAEGAAELLGLLQGCPGVRVIASSRERLELPGEWLLPVGGLPWPAPEDLAEADRFDAVQLFGQAAHAVQPRLDLQAERAAVTKLCAWVQGMPLALKLAAAWTRHLSLAEILHDLEQGAALLREGASAPVKGARPGGLDAVFAQSWARLAASEQAALVSLACCRGGFDAEAARAVADARGPLLAALLDKSLLQRQEAPAAAGPRFSLHPLLQQWLLDRRDPRTEPAQARHAHHYLGWLAGLPPGSRAGPRRAMLALARLEQENLRAAWRHAVHSAQAPLLAAATLPLMATWLEAGSMADGVALLDAAEPVLGSMAQRGVLDGARAVLLLPLARYREVEACSRRALQAARRSGDTLLRRGALSTLGSALLMLGHGAAARRCIDQALGLARQAGDRPAEAHFLWKLSMQDHAAGQLERAEAEVIESIALHEAMGEVPLGLRNNLATMLHLRGDHAGARAQYEPALAQATARGDGARRHLAFNLALLAMDEGDTAQAQARLVPLMNELRDGVQAELLAMGWLLQSRLDLAAGRRAQALVAVQAAGTDALQRQSLPMMASTLLHGALWRHAQGDAPGALRWAQAACAAPALVYLHRLLAERTLRAWGHTLTAPRPGQGSRAQAEVRTMVDELMRCA